MRELVRTNNVVLVCSLQALLDAAAIPYMVLDQNMSVLEGSIGILPRRLLVAEDDADDARRVLEEAGFGSELRLENGWYSPVLDHKSITEDAILGGRLRLQQPRVGHRIGHDAILLAAACPATAGDRVVELGAGVGAAGLALALRVPGVEVVLVELDEEFAALARENISANALGQRVSVTQLDVTARPKMLAAAGLMPDSVNRVLMNPPFNDLHRQRPSPDVRRRLAHSAPAGTLAAWIATAMRLLRPAGTLTMIWRADALDGALRALEAFGAIAVLPIHARPGQAAVRVLIRASKSSRTPLALLPGIFLNDASGRSSQEAESILRGGASLPLAQIP